MFSKLFFSVIVTDCLLYGPPFIVLVVFIFAILSAVISSQVLLAVIPEPEILNAFCILNTCLFFIKDYMFNRLLMSYVSSDQILFTIYRFNYLSIFFRLIFLFLLF